MLIIHASFCAVLSRHMIMMTVVVVVVVIVQQRQHQHDHDEAKTVILRKTGKQQPVWRWTRWLSFEKEQQRPQREQLL